MNIEVSPESRASGLVKFDFTQLSLSCHRRALHSPEDAQQTRRREHQQADVAARDQHVVASAHAGPALVAIDATSGLSQNMREKEVSAHRDVQHRAPLGAPHESPRSLRSRDDE